MKTPLRILITAGPTIEAIDPVRFISNRSTGLLGYELAKLAGRRGYAVTLISGPTNIEPPREVKFVRIETAKELSDKVHVELRKANVLIMASAVSNFRPASFSKKKIKSQKSLTLKLLRNADILGSFSDKNRKNKIIVGFSLETDNLLKNAAEKMKIKKLDMIIANKLDRENVPFGTGVKTVYILDKHGRKKKLTKMTKKRIAGAILDTIEELCYTP